MYTTQDLLQVMSCSRTSTIEGYSSIHAVVQLNNDGKMQGVKENVRLHFTFLREPQHESDGDEDDEVIYADADEYSSDGCGEESKSNEQPTKKRKRTAAKDDSPLPSDRDSNFTPKTIVTYKIDYSVDYGKMEQLLGVDVYASGKHPSAHEAIPIIDDSSVDEANDDEANGCDDDSNHCLGNNCCKGEENDTKKSPTHFEEVEMSDDDDNSCNNEDVKNDDSQRDRFGVFINPENVVAFLDRTNINLNEQSVFYFLLTLPFYEHEWDISGFLLSALFDEDEDDLGEEDSAAEDFSCDRPCCSGDQPCCN